MSTTSYQIFIVRQISESESTDISPLEDSFLNVNKTLFPGGKEFEYLIEPEAKSNTGQTACKVETLIGNSCGRIGCLDCSGTHSMIPATPDYGIFNLARKKWDETSGVIIVKNTTSTVSSASIINDAIICGEELGNGFDLFFLAKWLDRPDQFTILKSVSGGASGSIFKIVKTWNAHGFQALVFSKEGFEKLSLKYPEDTNPVVCRPFSQVINTLIQNGELNGVTTTPSLMQYDATLVESVCDSTAAAISGVPAIHSYLRTAECRGSTVPEKPLNRRISSDISLFWLCLISITVIITTWIILNITGKSTLTPIGERISK